MLYSVGSWRVQIPTARPSARELVSSVLRNCATFLHRRFSDSPGPGKAESAEELQGKAGEGEVFGMQIAFLEGLSNKVDISKSRGSTL